MNINIFFRIEKPCIAIFLDLKNKYSDTNGFKEKLDNDSFSKMLYLRIYLSLYIDAYKFRRLYGKSVYMHVRFEKSAKNRTVFHKLCQRRF